jgi:hypothetical protein
VAHLAPPEHDGLSDPRQQEQVPEPMAGLMKREVRADRAEREGQQAVVQVRRPHPAGEPEHDQHHRRTEHRQRHGTAKGSIAWSGFGHDRRDRHDRTLDSSPGARVFPVSAVFGGSPVAAGAATAERGGPPS